MQQFTSLSQLNHTDTREWVTPCGRWRLVSHPFHVATMIEDTIGASLLSGPDGAPGTERVSRIERACDPVQALRLLNDAIRRVTRDT